MKKGFVYLESTIKNPAMRLRREQSALSPIIMANPLPEAFCLLTIMSANVSSSL